MKKKFALMGSISFLCIGISALVVLSSKNTLIRIQGVEDNYSITIKAEDITTSTTKVSGYCVAHTDQLDNPIMFNYENIKYQQEGENKYIVFGEDAWLGNDNNSQIRKIDKFVVYGDNGAFTYDYGWNTKIGSIVYTGQDHSGLANGVEISLDDNQPNYFVLMHRDNEDDLKVSKIVLIYSKDCTPGEKPAPILDHIALNGQTTSLSRGGTFSFGGTVSAYYNDGSTIDVTSQTTFSGYNMSK